MVFREPVWRRHDSGRSVFYLIVAMIFPYSGAALLAWSLHLAAFAGPLLVSALVIARYARKL